MRKTILFFLTVLIIACLTGCGRKAVSSTDKADSPPPMFEQTETAPGVSTPVENTSQAAHPINTPVAKAIPDDTGAETEPTAAPAQVGLGDGTDSAAKAAAIPASFAR